MSNVKDPTTYSLQLNPTSAAMLMELLSKASAPGPSAYTLAMLYEDARRACDHLGVKVQQG